MKLLICNDIYTPNRSKLIHIVKIMNLDNYDCVWCEEGEDFEELISKAMNVCETLQNNYRKEYIDNQLKLLFSEDTSYSD